jgi:hypothetical protein
MSNLMKIHSEVVKRIGCYLLGTRDKGFILRPNFTKSFECYVDADYCGNWNPLVAEDPSTAKSRTGYVITYMGCLLCGHLAYKLCLLSALQRPSTLLFRQRCVMSFLLTEPKETGYDVQDKPTHCKLFEDNSGALEFARVAKYRPRTRHINAAWHHFRSSSRFCRSIRNHSSATSSPSKYHWRTSSVSASSSLAGNYGHSERRSERIMGFDQARSHWTRAKFRWASNLS